MKSCFIPRFLALIVLLAISKIGLFANVQKGFIENIGQITDQNQNKRADVIAKYTAGNGLNIFLSKDGIHYQWSKDSEMFRMDVKLIGANDNPKITKELPTTFKEKYQHALVKGTANGFEKITYHNIYPNIDWIFYFNEQGKLEHDFIVKAGGKISDIKLQYAGADNLKIDRFGNLIATTKYGGITEPAPYSYELATNKKIHSSYQLSVNTLTFKAGSYNGTLVIDPVIDWATYFGGSEYDEIRDVKTGKDGFVYAVGATNSTSNIATIGAHLTTFQGGSNSIGSDAFLTKFDTDGNCIWATYYGGTNVDLGLSLTVDTAGYLYMAGRTNSLAGIATVGSHQATKAGTSSGYDVFLTKFDTAGSLVWGTYYGGTGADGQQTVAIAADKFGNLYLSGNTQSANGIATIGAFQNTRPGGQDGFIAKFNTTGNLTWATYFGTSSNDWINDITTDTIGNVIVVGQTVGTTGLSTTGAYLETGNGGTDGFVAKFDSAGQRVWSTYYGGNGADILNSVVSDNFNSIYIAGITESANDIGTPQANQSVLGGLQDFCLAKFSSSGSIEWSTYFGGSDNEAFPSLAFYNQILYVTGETVSTNNISTPDGIAPVFNGSVSEGFLTTFNPIGQRIWSTYLGGDLADGGRSITITNDEKVLIGGKTASVNGLASIGAHQSTFAGNEDGWLVQVNMCDVPETPTSIVGSTAVCENTMQQYTVAAVNGGDSYEWLLPNGWTGASITDTIDVIVGANNGAIKVVAINSCGASDTVSLSLTVNAAPEPLISRSGNILSVSQSFPSYQWILDGDPILGATNPTHIAIQNGNYTLEVESANSCKGVSNEILIDDLTSINKTFEQLGIEVFPNPFITEFYIKSSVDLKLRIVDVLGKTVSTIIADKGTTSIDLSEFSAGNYLLQVYNPVNNELLGVINLIKLSN